MAARIYLATDGDPALRRAMVDADEGVAAARGRLADLFGEVERTVAELEWLLANVQFQSGLPAEERAEVCVQPVPN